MTSSLAVSSVLGVRFFWQWFLLFLLCNKVHCSLGGHHGSHFETMAVRISVQYAVIEPACFSKPCAIHSLHSSSICFSSQLASIMQVNGSPQLAHRNDDKGSQRSSSLHQLHCAAWWSDQCPAAEMRLKHLLYSKQWIH